MDTEITKLIQALRGISNKLEEIYGKPTETKEKVEPQMPMQNPVQELQMPAVVAPQSNQLVTQGSFDIAPVSGEFTSQVVQETDADKIKRLERELNQMKHQNINFNFAPTAIGGTYGQGNY